MGNLEYERLHENLKMLKLNTCEALLDNYLEIAAKKELNTIEVLDYLFGQECAAKEAKRYEFRTRLAGFPYVKTLEQFDFSFQPSIDRKMIRELCSLKFAYNAENVIFLGPPGVGKTHLSVALGVVGIKAGLSVHYAQAHELIDLLKKAFTERYPGRKLKNLYNSKLLIIDEIGYLPFDKEGANLFFQLISRRYEKGSVVITSNKPFSEWDTIFGDTVIASAILDRVLHHCTVINIKGNSYRLKARKKLAVGGGRKIEKR